MPQQNTGHFGVNSPQYVHGRKNLDYVPGASAHRASNATGASVEHAKSDFIHHVPKEVGMSIYDAVNHSHVMLKHIDFEDQVGNEPSGEAQIHGNVSEGEAETTRVWKDNEDNIMSLGNYHVNAWDKAKEILGSGYEDVSVEELPEHHKKRLNEAAVWYMEEAKELVDNDSSSRAGGVDVSYEMSSYQDSEFNISTFFSEDKYENNNITVGDLTTENDNAFSRIMTHHERDIAHRVMERMEQWDADNPDPEETGNRHTKR